jgi:hypothetical protein
MICLSLNYRGLGSTSKKHALKRLVESLHLEILLLRKTKEEGRGGGVLYEEMAKLLCGWEFISNYSKSRLEGVISIWRPIFLSCFHSWSFESDLGLSLYSQEMGKEILVLNLYGPCNDIIYFWGNFFKLSFLGFENIIVGGDLNFSLINF